MLRAAGLGAALAALALVAWVGLFLWSWRRSCRTPSELFKESRAGAGHACWRPTAALLAERGGHGQAASSGSTEISPLAGRARSSPPRTAASTSISGVDPIGLGARPGRQPARRRHGRRAAARSPSSSPRTSTSRPSARCAASSQELVLAIWLETQLDKDADPHPLPQPRLSRRRRLRRRGGVAALFRQARQGPHAAGGGAAGRPAAGAVALRADQRSRRRPRARRHRAAADGRPGLITTSRRWSTPAPGRPGWRAEGRRASPADFVDWVLDGPDPGSWASRPRPRRADHARPQAAGAGRGARSARCCAEAAAGARARRPSCVLDPAARCGPWSAAASYQPTARSTAPSAPAASRARRSSRSSI